MCEKSLCIIELADVDEAIELANEQWPHLENYAESMREINSKLDEDKGWLCILGVCDICGAKEAHFIPACAFSSRVNGIECPGCGNMSVFPQEVDVESLNEENDDAN